MKNEYFSIGSIRFLSCIKCANLYVLIEYGKSIIRRVIDLLDENYIDGVNDQVGWALIELDQQGLTTDRLLQVLHEDFLEFDALEPYKAIDTITKRYY